MDRIEFNKIRQQKGIYSCRTSGSTGIPVLVQKYHDQLNNYRKHAMLFHKWHDWDIKGETLRLGPAYTDEPRRRPGSVITHSRVYIPGNYKYLISYPELFPYDLFQFEKIASYGGAWTGIGIDMYSSEEFGYIAIQCPHNPSAMHIMDNLEIKFTDDGMRITDVSHPYLKDYEIGDWAEPIECNCGIKLRAMSHVKGRIRNMLKFPSGKTIWPVFGLFFHTEVERFQIFQESIDTLRVHYTGTFPEEAKETIRKSLGYDFEIKTVYADFKPGKYEEFICEI
jgi:hypothetical protein